MFQIAYATKVADKRRDLRLTIGDPSNRNRAGSETPRCFIDGNTRLRKDLLAKFGGRNVGFSFKRLAEVSGANQ